MTKKSSRPSDVFLTSTQASQLLNISVGTLKKYIHQGKIKTLKTPGGHHRFFNGFALEFPEGYAGIVKDKGSISNAGLHAMGGIFDAGFRGEYNVHLVNLSDKPYTVEVGDKVAQLVIFPVAHAKLVEAKELSDSSRGEGRFGSTGRK